jgi:predicted transcriptional regulator of viral defense system
MPRRGRSGAAPDWDMLYENAAASAGYVATCTAHDAGFSNQLLRYYVNAGRLERAARGIYRLVHFPASDHEDLVVVWLWSERQGVFSHETALALHQLSDAMPALRHLTLPSTWASRRARVPDGVESHYADLEPDEVAWVGPIPVTSPGRTLRDCVRAAVQPDLVDQAAEQIERRGLLPRSSVQRILREARK